MGTFSKSDIAVIELKIFLNLQNYCYYSYYLYYYCNYKYYYYRYYYSVTIITITINIIITIIIIITIFVILLLLLLLIVTHYAQRWKKYFFMFSKTSLNIYFWKCMVWFFKKKLLENLSLF